MYIYYYHSINTECGATDDTPKSSQWEEEYFMDEQVCNECYSMHYIYIYIYLRFLVNQRLHQLAPLLQDKSVTLRLEAGTQEAGFLTSFCPISTFPAVVIIMYVWSLPHRLS